MFEITQVWKGHVSVQNVMKDISAFVPVSGAFVAMFIGGIDLMMLLADFVQARREKRIEAAAVAAREEGLAKGIAKGIEEGRQEGITVGRQEGRQEVYHEIAAWD